MGKAGFVIFTSLTLVSLLAPVAAADTACVPVVGSCVDAETDGDPYVCERAQSSTRCFAYVDGRTHTLDVFEAQMEDHLVVDAGSGGASFSYDRTRSPEIGSEHVAASAGPGGVAAAHRANWADVDSDGSRSSFLCFVANVDGTLVGLACGDWLNGEITPVFVDRTGETVSEIRNDPLVRCVTTRQCIV